MFNKLKSLGPGLLYAGAAIGVSHLVQSTKAGAGYGYILILAIVLAHLFKYPFFVVGPRYANSANQSLVSGYAKIGNWAVILLLILTVSTMFTVQAAVTVVTAGLAQNLTGVVLPPWAWSVILLAVCFLILQIGNFSILEKLMKVVMVVLAVTTVSAFFFSFLQPHTSFSSLINSNNFSFAKKEDLGFLISFVGWMPAPLDIAIWHSIWSVTNARISSKKRVKVVNFDFRIGFYGTAILGLCFVILGANIMFGSSVEIASSAVGFANQLIELFTQSLGQWSYVLIIVAAFTTMFSTTLTCLDAMPRVLNEITLQLKLPKLFTSLIVLRLVLVLGALVILVFYISSMKQMVVLATTISFLTAPILGLLTIKLVRDNKNLKLWNSSENTLAYTGVVLLFALSILYVVEMF